jgi:hypothetical protein
MGVRNHFRPPKPFDDLADFSENGSEEGGVGLITGCGVIGRERLVRLTKRKTVQHSTACLDDV